ncbi:MAG: prepilin-type N-terminal cleavage/methylation domain-containing protein, partial [Elusimicrobia bacterium]|nr:prepilin-type N-terminal cleavage/methylation domain-containing protein [Elusimicrobiota bacterium]
MDIAPCPISRRAARANAERRQKGLTLLELLLAMLLLSVVV